MTNTDSKRETAKNWLDPIKAAVDAANEAVGTNTSGPGALATLLGLSRATIYQWKDEVPADHAITIWRDTGLHPSITCPSRYPRALFGVEDPVPGGE